MTDHGSTDNNERLRALLERISHLTNMDRPFVEWEQFHDYERESYYYHNIRTGTTTWDQPLLFTRWTTIARHTRDDMLIEADSDFKEFLAFADALVQEVTAETRMYAHSRENARKFIQHATTGDDVKDFWTFFDKEVQETYEQFDGVWEEGTVINYIEKAPWWKEELPVFLLARGFRLLPFFRRNSQHTRQQHNVEKIVNAIQTNKQESATSLGYWWDLTQFFLPRTRLAARRMRNDSPDPVFCVSSALLDCTDTSAELPAAVAKLA